MTERKGRIEDWDDSLYGCYIYVVESNGDVNKSYTEHDGKYFIEPIITQGNAFYDRESAELAARKRAAQVKFERLCKKHNADLLTYPEYYFDEDNVTAIYEEMGEDMEYLK